MKRKVAFFLLICMVAAWAFPANAEYMTELMCQGIRIPLSDADTYNLLEDIGQYVVTPAAYPNLSIIFLYCDDLSQLETKYDAASFMDWMFGDGSYMQGYTCKSKVRQDGLPYAIAEGVRSGNYMRMYTFIRQDYVYEILYVSGTPFEEQELAYIDAQFELISAEDAGISEDAYKSKCEPITYKQIARNPNKTIGKHVVVNGEVIQVVENGLSVLLRVNITESRRSYSDTAYYFDTIYVNYCRESEDEDRILEDDIVTIWGTLAGMTSQTTIFSSVVTEPTLNAAYISIDSME